MTKVFFSLPFYTKGVNDMYLFVKFYKPCDRDRMANYATQEDLRGTQENPKTSLTFEGAQFSLWP